MDIASKRLKLLPLRTVLAAKNYGMDNVTAPENASLGSQLCMAILRGDNLETRKLLAENVSLHHQEEPDGWTPLIYSIYYSNHTAVKMLLDMDVDPNRTDYANRTPLMFAAIKNNIPLIIELLRRGADISAIDYRGKSALDFAMEYRNREAIELLSQLYDQYWRK